MRNPKRIQNFYRGPIELPAMKHGKPSYAWHAGYSENGESGGALSGWMTKRECQRDARNRGAVAEFTSCNLPPEINPNPCNYCNSPEHSSARHIYI